MKSSDAGASTAATDKGESNTTFAALAAESTDKSMQETVLAPRKQSSIKNPDDQHTSIAGKVDKSDSSQEEEEKKVFKGLGNQGATCYMNSCLQSLYMTPDFREMIYKWK